MNFYEYQKAASRTISIKDKTEMTYHAVLGLCSESGEVSGIYQKKYQGHPIDKEHVMKEIGDVLWFLAELCTSLEINIEDCAEMNIEKLLKRYPCGFSPYRSMHRNEGDV